MDEAATRAQATALCDALVAGNIDQAIEHFSQELRRNIGEVISMLPLPCIEATVGTIEHSGSGQNVILHLVGESDEVEVQTRWKDRNGQPTIIEASHLSQRAREIAGDAEASDRGRHRARGGLTARLARACVAS